MTKVKNRRTGEVMYLIGVMPMQGKKGGCGGNAVAICAADPRRHSPGVSSLPYTLAQYPMKFLEIIEEFDWDALNEPASEPVEADVVVRENDEIIPNVKQSSSRSKPMGPRMLRIIERMRKGKVRFEASQEFARMSTDSPPDDAC